MRALAVQAECITTIKNHKKNFDGQPGFFYLPLQNVHVPLESPGDQYDEACKDIVNTDRKTFCAMAAAADDAIGNLTALIKEQFQGEDYLVVISGDNGGMPSGAGNNWPLRGHKAELWEGGIMNNEHCGVGLPRARSQARFDIFPRSRPRH